MVVKFNFFSGLSFVGTEQGVFEGTVADIDWWVWRILGIWNFRMCNIWLFVVGLGILLVMRWIDRYRSWWWKLCFPVVRYCYHRVWRIINQSCCTRYELLDFGHYGQLLSFWTQMQETKNSKNAYVFWRSNSMEIDKQPRHSNSPLNYYILCVGHGLETELQVSEWIQWF